MSRNMKIVLGIVGGIVICCTLSVIAGIVFLPQLASSIEENVLLEDPGEAAQVRQEIVDYELPAGFEETGMSILGMNMIFAISGNGNEGMIMIVSYPESTKGGDEAEMRAQMERMFQQQSGRQDIHMIYKGEEEITVNAESVTLDIYEGTDERGVDVRQATGAFQTKQDTLGMMMIFAPLDSWEEQGLDDFLASME